MKWAGKVFLVVLLFVLGACSSAGQSEGSQIVENESAASHAHGAAAESTDAWDKHFLDGMIVHHEGAVEMAQQAVDQAEHTELRTFAEAIITAQTAEIAQMQEWREIWFPGEPVGEVDSHDMGAMSVADDESLPFDQRFLQAMISHHEGALAMANDAESESGRDEIRTLAAAIQEAQQQEIEQMRAWLQQWYGVIE